MILSLYKFLTIILAAGYAQQNGQPQQPQQPHQVQHPGQGYMQQQPAGQPPVQQAPGYQQQYYAGQQSQQQAQSAAGQPLDTSAAQSHAGAAASAVSGQYPTSSTPQTGFHQQQQTYQQPVSQNHTYYSLKFFCQFMTLCC